MLPTSDKPTFTITMPSDQTPVRFRMMTRREEKILLIAKEGEFSDQLDAIRQVLTNCAVQSDKRIDDLPTFDAEYAFLQLRGCSIGTIEKISYIDHDDEKEYEVTVDLSKVEVKNVGKPGVIEVPGGMKIELRYPSVRTWGDPAIMKAENTEDMTDALVKHCIHKIWMGSTVYDFGTVGDEEARKFLENLDLKTWDKIREFLTNMPHLSYQVGWTNSKGAERKVELRDLRDFFSF